MKIIRLTTFLDFGGIERKMENLSSWKDDNIWIFVAIGKGGTAEFNIRKNKKTVYCLEISHKIPCIKTIYTLYRLFKKEKPYIVHTAGAEANFHGIIAAWLAGVPKKISEEIGIPKHGRMAKLVFRKIFNLSDYVVGESKIVISFLREQYRISDSKLSQISNFIIPSSSIYKDKSESESFRIVSISRLASVKNIQSVLRIIPQIVTIQPNIFYTIVGDGQEKKKLMELTETLDISRYVKFVGFQNNPFDYLSQSDLYLITSFSEGFSNSLLEAMLSGIPSLSPRVGGAEEIIEDGVNGWLVEPDSDEDLYNKIVKIITLPSDERIILGLKGQKTIFENYTLENQMDKLLKIYNYSIE